ncbi:MAG: addiction module toxin RelE [Xanthomonadaceae bacterium]|nr:addiction module toxin RelE [Xanthomonadaceae bacterium]
MPSWSDKDRRQYEHVKESAAERGVSEKRAKEMAGRTVNKQRRQEGRTPSARTQGTGNPRLRLEQRSRQELYNRARELGIVGRSRMSKHELTVAIRNARCRGPGAGGGA